jgi:nucleoside-diphosphate-sugar epimerase
LQLPFLGYFGCIENHDGVFKSFGQTGMSAFSAVYGYKGTETPSSSSMAALSTIQLYYLIAIPYSREPPHPVISIMMSAPKTVIPKGSWILITGLTGYVASQTAKQFLERGYYVRGTVRDIGKASSLVDGHLKSYKDSGHLELALVPDLGADHAFDEAVKGVSAIAHVATISTFDPDPSTVIPQTIAGVTSILHAALKEPSVRRFVYTSSIVAATTIEVGSSTHVGRDTWNDAAVEAAWAPPPYEPSRGFIVYQASKVVGEREVWKFAAEKNPQFTVNVVCPQTIIGELVGRHAQSFTAHIIPSLYNNNGDISSFVPVLPASKSQPHPNQDNFAWSDFLTELL